MSHIVIVGASTGIGRDIQLPLMMLGHDVEPLRRGEDLPQEADGLLLCQRFRGHGDDWAGEIAATMGTAKWYIEHMDCGSIVVMASVAAVSVEEEQPVSYHACKAAVVEMVKYYAVTLAPQVRVNAILPGLTIKPEARAFYDEHAKLEQVYADITPMGRTCYVEDLAQAVDYLMKANYVTGHVLPVDGGIGLRSHWAVARKVHPELKDIRVTQRR